MKITGLDFAMWFWIAVAAILLIGKGIKAQAPPMTFPDHDVAYTCVPTDGAGAPVQFTFTNTPTARFDVKLGPTPASPDRSNPVITAITNSAGADLTTGAIRLLAVNNGLSLTISASDDVGIVTGKLEVDGKMATPFGNGLDVLPNPFYVRWNSKTIPAGSHALRLSVCDAGLNCAERTWSMTR